MPKLKQWHPEPAKFDIRALTPEREYVRVQRPKPVTDDEPPLTGMVQGQRASDIEERFARALDKLSKVTRYDFLPTILAPPNMAGSIQIDFMVYAGEVWPVQLDGDWVHKSAEAKAHDQLQDALADEYFASAGYGAQPQQRIPGHLISNQQDADQLVRTLF